MQQDLNQKISIVINKHLPTWQVLNAVAHISAYFGNELGEQLTTGEYFKAKDGVLFPRNSQYPIITLAANPDQLQPFAKRVRKDYQVQKMFFIREMIETNSDEQIIEWLNTKNGPDIELLGVGIFGPNERVRQLTGEFKLWS